jgi:hypothetical protein
MADSSSRLDDSHSQKLKKESGDVDDRDNGDEDRIDEIENVKHRIHAALRWMSWRPCRTRIRRRIMRARWSSRNLRTQRGLLQTFCCLLIQAQVMGRADVRRNSPMVSWV